MAENKHIDKETGTETVGHEWDGIEELDTPMPRWWLWTLYATIVWGIGYVILYPAWPLINSATAGTLGWTSRGQLAAEMKADADAKRPVMNALAATPIEKLGDNPELLNAAVQGGSAAFKVNCIQCHGSGAAGTKGYPNLNDDDWLWGGDLVAIHQTIEHGIREPADKATRMSMMPAFGRDGVLQPGQIQDVTSFVRTLSGAEKVSASSQRGAALYAANCITCHGPTGHGDRLQGAPNLTDKIWLYGGDRSSIAQTITNARYGVMPAWGHRLDPVTIKMLSAYVHSLGGGEKFVEQPAVPPANQAEAANNQDAAR